MSSQLSSIAVDTDASSLRYELDMLYNFSFLMLWRPLLLELLSNMKEEDGFELDPNDIQFALACVNLAETCHLRSEEMATKGRIKPFSWATVYTAFLSEAYVLALLSLEGLATRLRGDTYAALGGLRMLAASRCGVACATPALRVLKVSRSLRHDSPR